MHARQQTRPGHERANIGGQAQTRKRGQHGGASTQTHAARQEKIGERDGERARERGRDRDRGREREREGERKRGRERERETEKKRPEKKTDKPTPKTLLAPRPRLPPPPKKKSLKEKQTREENRKMKTATECLRPRCQSLNLFISDAVSSSQSLSAKRTRQYGE